jgi:hypothetical protein
VFRDRRAWLINEVSDLIGPGKENRAAGAREFLAEFDYRFLRISPHKRLGRIDTASLRIFQNILACLPGKSPPEWK